MDPPRDQRLLPLPRLSLAVIGRRVFLAAAEKERGEVRRRLSRRKGGSARRMRLFFCPAPFPFGTQIVAGMEMRVRLGPVSAVAPLALSDHYVWNCPS